MSRFMRYGRNVRPSDSYLKTHELPYTDVYDPDTWFDDCYNLEDDIEILTMPRICENCGRQFTIEEASDEYSEILSSFVIGFDPYTSAYEGEYCGECAAEDFESRAIYPEDLED